MAGYYSEFLVEEEDALIIAAETLPYPTYSPAKSPTLPPVALLRQGPVQSTSQLPGKYL
jgi:hypothetical protein|tara:strand:+ start:222 stop:398 length:177 start_codon:yes stop_codon:yes gene_type:complete